MVSSPSQSATKDTRIGGRIYSDFFKLEGAPFSITPDPDFLFLSETHRNVIEKIQYGIESRMGFMLLTGEVGTGKSTLSRVLLDQLHHQAQTVYLINPSLSAKELIAAILDDLGVTWPARATKKVLIDHLNRFLLERDHTTPVVIIIDDAQTMPSAALEDLRLLSNLETDKQKLLQMLLVGQPELRQRLDCPELRQLKQRITVNCFLDYLTQEEVRGYIDQRLFVAGNQGQVRFDPKTIPMIHKQSNGIPRMINKLCDMALTAAYASSTQVVGLKHLRIAYDELIESTAGPSGRKWPCGRHPHLRWLLAIGLILGLLLALSWYYPITTHLNDVTAATSPTSEKRAAGVGSHGSGALS